MDDGGLAAARLVKAELVERLERELRFAGIGITTVNGRAAVQVNRSGGPPLTVDAEIRGVPVVQRVVGAIRPL